MKKVIITGCNRGVGAGIRNLFISNDFVVYGLNKTASDLKHSNYNEIICDISKSDQILSAKKEIPNDIDLLVNNAAIRRFGEVKSLSDDDWIDSVNTNLNAVFLITKTFLPNIISNKGDVFFIGSHSEKYSFEKGAAYCSTKGAVKHFSECIMEEVRYDDVRVSYLSIGAIKNRDHGYDESWKLTPENIAETIFQLYSLPKNILIPYLDVRPLTPLKNPLDGLERLQYV